MDTWEYSQMNASPLDEMIGNVHSEEILPWLTELFEKTMAADISRAEARKKTAEMCSDQINARAKGIFENLISKCEGIYQTPLFVSEEAVEKSLNNSLTESFTSIVGCTDSELFKLISCEVACAVNSALNNSRIEGHTVVIPEDNFPKTSRDRLQDIVRSVRRLFHSARNKLPHGCFRAQEQDEESKGETRCVNQENEIVTVPALLQTLHQDPIRVHTVCTEKCCSAQDDNSDLTPVKTPVVEIHIPVPSLEENIATSPVTITENTNLSSRRDHTQNPKMDINNSAWAMTEEEYNQLNASSLDEMICDVPTEEVLSWLRELFEKTTAADISRAEAQKKTAEMCTDQINARAKGIFENLISKVAESEEMYQMPLFVSEEAVQKSLNNSLTESFTSIAGCTDAELFKLISCEVACAVNSALINSRIEGHTVVIPKDNFPKTSRDRLRDIVCSVRRLFHSARNKLPRGCWRAQEQDEESKEDPKLVNQEEELVIVPALLQTLHQDLKESIRVHTVCTEKSCSAQDDDSDLTPVKTPVVEIHIPVPSLEEYKATSPVMIIEHTNLSSRRDHTQNPKMDINSSAWAMTEEEYNQLNASSLDEMICDVPTEEILPWLTELFEKTTAADISRIEAQKKTAEMCSDQITARAKGIFENLISKVAESEEMYQMPLFVSEEAVQKSLNNSLTESFTSIAGCTDAELFKLISCEVACAVNSALINSRIEGHTVVIPEDNFPKTSRDRLRDIVCSVRRLFHSARNKLPRGCWRAQEQDEESKEDPKLVNQEEELVIVPALLQTLHQDPKESIRVHTVCTEKSCSAQDDNSDLTPVKTPVVEIHIPVPSLEEYKATSPVMIIEHTGLSSRRDHTQNPKMDINSSAWAMTEEEYNQLNASSLDEMICDVPTEEVLSWLRELFEKTTAADISRAEAQKKTAEMCTDQINARAKGIFENLISKVAESEEMYQMPLFVSEEAVEKSLNNSLTESFTSIAGCTDAELFKLISCEVACAVNSALINSRIEGHTVVIPEDNFPKTSRDRLRDIVCSVRRLFHSARNKLPRGCWRAQEQDEESKEDPKLVNQEEELVIVPALLQTLHQDPKESIRVHTVCTEKSCSAQDDNSDLTPVKTPVVEIHIPVPSLEEYKATSPVMIIEHTGLSSRRDHTQNPKMDMNSSAWAMTEEEYNQLNASPLDEMICDVPTEEILPWLTELFEKTTAADISRAEAQKKTAEMCTDQINARAKGIFENLISKVAESEEMYQMPLFVSEEAVQKSLNNSLTESFTSIAGCTDAELFKLISCEVACAVNSALINSRIEGHTVVIPEDNFPKTSRDRLRDIVCSVRRLFHSARNKLPRGCWRAQEQDEESKEDPKLVNQEEELVIVPALLQTLHQDPKESIRVHTVCTEKSCSAQDDNSDLTPVKTPVVEIHIPVPSLEEYKATSPVMIIEHTGLSSRRDHTQNPKMDINSSAWAMTEEEYNQLNASSLDEMICDVPTEEVLSWLRELFEKTTAADISRAEAQKKTAEMCTDQINARAKGIFENLISKVAESEEMYQMPLFVSEEAVEKSLNNSLTESFTSIAGCTDAELFKLISCEVACAVNSALNNSRIEGHTVVIPEDNFPKTSRDRLRDIVCFVRRLFHSARNKLPRGCWRAQEQDEESKEDPKLVNQEEELVIVPALLQTLHQDLKESIRVHTVCTEKSCSAQDDDSDLTPVKTPVVEIHIPVPSLEEYKATSPVMIIEHTGLSSRRDHTQNLKMDMNSSAWAMTEEEYNQLNASPLDEMICDVPTEEILPWLTELFEKTTAADISRAEAQKKTAEMCTDQINARAKGIFENLISKVAESEEMYQMPLFVSEEAVEKSLNNSLTESFTSIAGCTDAELFKLISCEVACAVNSALNNSRIEGHTVVIPKDNFPKTSRDRLRDIVCSVRRLFHSARNKLPRGCWRAQEQDEESKEDPKLVNQEEELVIVPALLQTLHQDPKESIRVHTVCTEKSCSAQDDDSDLTPVKTPVVEIHIPVPSLEENRATSPVTIIDHTEISDHQDPTQNLKMDIDSSAWAITAEEYNQINMLPLDEIIYNVSTEEILPLLMELFEETMAADISRIEAQKKTAEMCFDLITVLAKSILEKLIPNVSVSEEMNQMPLFVSVEAVEKCLHNSLTESFMSVAGCTNAKLFKIISCEVTHTVNSALSRSQIEDNRVVVPEDIICRVVADHLRDMVCSVRKLFHSGKHKLPHRCGRTQEQDEDAKGEPTHWNQEEKPATVSALVKMLLSDPKESTRANTVCTVKSSSRQRSPSPERPPSPPSNYSPHHGTQTSRQSLYRWEKLDCKVLAYEVCKCLYKGLKDMRHADKKNVAKELIEPLMERMSTLDIQVSPDLYSVKKVAQSIARHLCENSTREVTLMGLKLEPSCKTDIVNVICDHLGKQQATDFLTPLKKMWYKTFFKSCSDY